MPIPFRNYVDISSNVGGAAAAAARDLMLRLFSISDQIPDNTVVEFADAASVGVYFNSTIGQEFLQAQFYFNFVGKLGTQASLISFAAWAQAATFAHVIGDDTHDDLDTLKLITDGTIEVTVGSNVASLTGLDFSADASLSDVADKIETALVLESGFAASTVVYEGAPGRFVFTFGVSGAQVCSIAPVGSGTDIITPIGWNEPEVRISDGSNITTLTTALQQTSALSNNFGSFATIPTLDAAEDLEAATWVDGENVTFMYLQKVLAADVASNFSALGGLSGVGATLYSASVAEFPWLLPGAIFGATQYLRRNSAANYMFQIDGALSALVTTGTLAATYDAASTNYYGNTQQAGSVLEFYQRGVLFGTVQDPLGMGIFANEIFLKDSIGVALINLLIAINALPANSAGVAQVLATIQPSLDVSLNAGIISVGRTLTVTQRAFVQGVTGDANSYIDLETIGYWITAIVAEPTPGNFEIQYTLLYTKNDAVRKITGVNSLV